MKGQTANSTSFKSVVPDEIWEAIRQKLIEGHRTVDLVVEFANYGVTANAIYSRNYEKWKILGVRGAGRGPICPHCGENRPNYRNGKCQQCYNAARRTGNPRPTGEKHPQWRGGKTKTAEYIRFTAEYKAWRKAVFARDNYTCVLCGTRGGYMQADHIKPQCAFPELRLALDNGRTLCLRCHRETDTYGAKAKKYIREEHHPSSSKASD